MRKVVAFIQNHIGRAGVGVSLRNQRVLADLLEHLARECEYLSPDVRTFSHRAETLVELLAATA